MSRRAPFTQADYTRAIKGALKAGLPVGSFEVVVENDRLRILPINAANSNELPPADPLDAELAAWGKRHGYD